MDTGARVLDILDRKEEIRRPIVKDQWRLYRHLDIKKHFYRHTSVHPNVVYIHLNNDQSRRYTRHLLCTDRTGCYSQARSNWVYKL